jgi:drug/metabolite transporter (DMT)-like permease
LTKLKSILEPSDNLRGMLWMTLSGAIFSINYGIIRVLAEDINVFELVFFRNLFGLIILLPFLWRARHEIRKPKRPGIILSRGVLQAGSSTLWFFGVIAIPLVTATSLMLIEPIIGSLLAIFFFKEKSDYRRWISVFFAIVGALFIIRPGIIEFSAGVSFILIAAVMWAGFLLLGKVQSREDPVVVVIAYSSSLTVILSLIPAVFFWVTPTFNQFLLLIVLGSVATFAYFCITNAYKAGEVTVVSPFTFMRTIFAATVGFIIFSEVPESWVWIGALIIVAAATYLARIEMGVNNNKKS